MTAAVAPERHHTQVFGCFALTGKITASAGPIILGLMTDAFESQRVGVASVVLFFAVGFVLMLTIDENRGIESARR